MHTKIIEAMADRGEGAITQWKIVLAVHKHEQTLTVPFLSEVVSLESNTKDLTEL